MRKERHRKLRQLVQSLVTGKLGSEPSLAWYLCFDQWHYRSTLSRILGAKQVTTKTKTNQTNPKDKKEREKSKLRNTVDSTISHVCTRKSLEVQTANSEWLARRVPNTGTNVRKAVLCSHLNYLPQKRKARTRSRRWSQREGMEG